MSKTSDKNDEALRVLRRFHEESEAILADEKVPVTNPRQLENVAPGLDADGELFPLHDSSGRVITQEQAMRRVKARDNLDAAEIEQLRAKFTEKDLTALMENIEWLRQKDPRSDDEDELLARSEAYYEALTAPNSFAPPKPD
jgi:hypothetical protein